MSIVLHGSTLEKHAVLNAQIGYIRQYKRNDMTSNNEEINE